MKRKLFSLVFGLAIPLSLQHTPASTPKNPSDVRGTIIKVFGKRLLIGTFSGGVEGFDSESGQFAYSLKGGSGPVQDIVSVDGHVWWVCKNSTILHTVDGALNPVEVDLAPSGIGGPIKRLSVWKNSFLAQSDTQFRFVESKTGVVADTNKILPTSVATPLSQGIAMANWEGGRGMIFSIRKYGQKTEPFEPGGTKDIAMISAWSTTTANRFKLLGSYTCSLTDFRDAPGPEVQIDIGNRHIRNPFGTADIGNIKLGPEGVVALTKNQTLLVPFARNNWMTQWQSLPTSPEYSQTMAFNASSVWWWSKGQLLQANLEDGACDVYVPKKPNFEVLGIAPVGQNVWILTNGGARLVQPDDVDNSGFLRYQLGPNSKKPHSIEQKQLFKVLDNPALIDKISKLHKNPTDTLKDLLNVSSIGTKKSPAAKRITKAQKVSDVQYGDLIKRNGQTGIYLGNGEVLALKSSTAIHETWSINADTSVLRILHSDGQVFASKVGWNGHSLLSNVFPVGILHPEPSLGHNLFVTIHSGGTKDHPFLDQHQRMSSIIEGWIGTPYVWGGNTKEGCDCSGFVTQVYHELGINLPRHSQDIGRAPFGEIITDELHYGDVLVFPNPKHVAIYVGNGKTAEAVSGGVGYSSIYRRRLAVVRRFIL